MRSTVSFALLSSALALTGCSSIPVIGGLADATSTTPNAGPCPAAGSLYEAQRIVVLEDNKPSFNSIEFTGEVTGVELFCRYINDNPIDAQIDLELAFGRGPAATASEYTYNVFVAVTRTNRTVIDKQVFPIRVKFDSGQDVAFKQETIARITIPRADSSVSGANFEILVGFDLTPEQEAFNKGGQRFLLQTN